MNERFKIIPEQITGDIIVKEHSQFNNINAQNVEVARSVHTRFFGTIANLKVNEGSRVWLHGSVTGKIENNGGRIFIFDTSGNIRST